VVDCLKLHFFLDPLENLNGPLRPPFLIAFENKKNFSAVFSSQYMVKEVADTLKTCGFDILDYHKSFYFSGSLLNMEAWLRNSELSINETDSIIVNFSQCFLTNAHIYYAQGPMTKALADMYPWMKKTHKIVYSLFDQFLSHHDRVFICKLRKKARFFVANSKFCAGMYTRFGVKVDGVIYPPLDCDKFKTSTSMPSRDYVLTYFGKETKFPVVKTIADAGIKIKSFGCKGAYVPNYILKHPNIEFMGKVSDVELVSYYSNALYTLFTFNHEPFGYIPVESMACNTPVLTYNIQGPSESVVDGETGWLVDTDEKIVEKAMMLWKQGYPERIRMKCRGRALDFGAKAIAEQWFKLAKEVEGQKTEWTPNDVLEPDVLKTKSPFC